MIDVLVGAGFSVKKCCEVLGVSSAGYYLAKTRPMSATMIRREWLTGLIREVHADSRGTYGARRVRAELSKGRGVKVSQVLVTLLMHNAGIVGILDPARSSASKEHRLRMIWCSASSSVRRSTYSGSPTSRNIQAREGKVFYCCVLDTCSRRIAGWSIDSSQDTNLVVNALDMAIKQRD